MLRVDGAWPASEGEEWQALEWVEHGEEEELELDKGEQFELESTDEPRSW